MSFYFFFLKFKVSYYVINHFQRIKAGRNEYRKYFFNGMSFSVEKYFHVPKEISYDNPSIDKL